jgi:flagellar hook-associated protein 3 FlgL
MRISTQQIYDSSITSIQQQASDVMKSQTQIASGRKYQNVSDSPQAVGYGMKLDFDKAQYDMFTINQKKMAERISNADAQLVSINSALAKFKQVVVQSGSAFAQGTLSTTLYQQAVSLRDSIKSFAQAKDTSGQPVLVNLDGSSDSLGRVAIDLNVTVDEGVSLAESMGTYDNNPDLVIDEDDNPVIDDYGNPVKESAVPGRTDILTVLDGIVAKLQAGTAPNTDDSRNVDNAITQIRGAQVKVGIMNAQVNNALDSVELKKVNAENARSEVLDTDIAESSANLAKSQALLQAAQSIFAKIQSSTLFDKI